MSDAQLAALLAQESAMGMPPESADSVKRARRSAAKPSRSCARRSRGPGALLALEGIRAADPAAYEALPAPERAEVYARSLASAQIFNAWGLPGFSLSDTARAVIALGEPAVAALRPLLADERPAPLFGSQDATTATAYGNRVRDYAFVLIAEILGVEYTYDESPAERDRQIAGPSVVGAGLEVGDQPGLRRLPAEQVARDRARGGRIGGEERAEPAEVLGVDRGGRQIQAAADRLGDRAGLDALVVDGVEDVAGGCGFEAEPEHPRGVEAVDGGPAVLARADVAGDALIAGGGDDHGHEAVVALAMDGRREAHDDRAHVVGRQGERQLRGGDARVDAVLRRVRLGAHAAGREPERARGDQERACRSP